MILVSVILPVRNGGMYLESALASLDQQYFQDFEVIAIDDGSTDNSHSILEEWATRNTRVKIISGNGRGIVDALNLGLGVAQGKYIARMDADDIAMAHRFEQQIAVMESHPDIVGLGTAVVMVDPEGRMLREIFPVVNHEDIMTALHRGMGTALVHPTTMFRRAAVEQVGGYREAYRHVEDFDLYLRLSDIGQLRNLAEIGLKYRQHAKSANSQHSRLQRRLIVTCLKERGIDLDWSIENDREETLVDLYLKWSSWALGGGYYLTGVRHGFRAVTLSRFELKTIRTFLGLLRLGRSNS